MNDDTTLSPEQERALYFNMHDVSGQQGTPLPDAIVAHLYGLTPDALAARQAGIDRELASAARELAATAAGSAFVQRFRQGQTVLFAGDSITTYRYSYARLAAHVLAAAGVHSVNRAYSGCTSTLGLELTYSQFIPMQPDWVFLKYGVNDGKQFWRRADGHKPLVSLDEYAANMRAILTALRSDAEARVVLLTPTLVVEEAVRASELLRTRGITWRNEDLHARGDMVVKLAREFGLPVVDLRDVLGEPPNAAWFLDDGLHPNAAGERRMAERMLATLADQASY
jgi:lysophospholipase L1-like esterase